MTSYVPLRSPWKHQEEALRRLEGQRAFALLMAMRTGKTKVIVDDFGRLELEGKIDDLFVIAPAGVYKTWTTAIKDHASLDLQKRASVLMWRAGAVSSVAKSRIKAFVEERERPRVLLMNIEAISSVLRSRNLCETFLKQRRVMLVVDESTTIKNPTSKRSRFIVNRLAPLATHRRILSGLPTPRSPLDAFNQFEFLDRAALGHSSYVSFKAEYCDEVKVCTLPTSMLAGKLKSKVGRSIQGYDIDDLPRKDILKELDERKIWYQSFPKLNGYKNEDKLKDKIAKLSYRVLLEDCYDLPPKMYSMREVEWDPIQKKHYEEIKQKATTELESMDHVTALSVISRMIRCHQVLCGHVRDEENKLHSIPEKRTEALIELLQEHDGKAVIWCSYDYNVKAVSGALEKEFGEGCCSRFWGGNSSSREEEELAFQTNPDRRFMIATAAAGGRGRMWAIADLVVYFSNTNDLEHRSQSEERTQGIDKVRSVGYVDLMVPGTVDERIINALRRKIDMAATITGDSWKEWLI